MNNGSYDKTIIIKGNINIYTPYDSFEHKTTDNMLLNNINFIKDNYKQNNKNNFQMKKISLKYADLNKCNIEYDALDYY